jgi:hypothetical protein
VHRYLIRESTGRFSEKSSDVDSWENDPMAEGEDFDRADDITSRGDDTAAPEQDDSKEGFDRWRQESAIGGIGTGIARGLQSVFGAPQQEIAIVAEVPGEPPDGDKRLRVILDPDDPTKSIAVVPASPTENSPPTESPPA